MPSELFNALFKRRSEVDTAGQTFESSPAKSNADAASHLAGLDFSQRLPSAQEWLRTLEGTPEEDALAGALADGLAERSQRLPSHAPSAPTPEDDSRLRAIAEALEEMRQSFAKDSAELGEVREELARREEQLRAREEALEAEKEQQRQREEARHNYPPPTWLENLENTINVGVVGNAGVGKSLLINKLRRVRPQADGWAPVGVNETTRHPTMYTFPSQPRVRLWDLPGAGTALVPSETYVQDMGLRYFDKVLIVTAGRFTSMEVTLKAELEEHRVPFFMVRTKVDIDCWNNKEDNGRSETETLAVISEDLKQTHGVADPYLVSSRNPEAYDMPRLVNELFPGLKIEMDASAPTFCPSAPAWNDPWAMPQIFSPVIAGLQGRWYDAYHAVYLVQNNTAHVTLQEGQCAVVPLEQKGGAVWWCGRWYVDESSVSRARQSSELRWSPTNLQDRALVWWWAD